MSSHPCTAPAPVPAELLIADLRLPAHSRHLALARLFARSAASTCGLDEERSYELEHAFNEAVTNAIRHGRPDARDTIRLSALWQGDRLTLSVQDSGTFLASPADGRGSAEGGRGLALMARFADEIEVDSEPGATTVRVSKLRR